MLLQLLRGSGPQGLSAMPRVRPLGPGRLCRPLLDFTRAELVRWAGSQRLTWMEDESNRLPERDRNFLRLKVLPLLRQRWPSLARSVSRSARFCAEVRQLVREQGEADREATLTDASDRLRWTSAAQLGIARRKNLLRCWIEENGMPLPNADRLEEMAHVLWEAGQDGQPLIHWPGAEVRRYRDTLYLGRPLPDWSPPQPIPWDGRTAVDLGAAGKLEVLEAGVAPGLRLHLTGTVEIRFRHGGEACRLAGRAGTRPVKKVLQELAIEPWLRDRVPLIYCDDRLAAIADRAVGDGFQCEPGAGGVVIRWHLPGGD